MPYLNIILGKPFYDLLQHGREIDRAIARRDASLLNHSTPELERYFSRPPGERPRQNPFPVAALFPLFLVAFAFKHGFTINRQRIADVKPGQFFLRCFLINH